MARIKKRGLDYFPLNTDFIHDRVVRRIMKREGDGAFSILIGTLSCIYAGEGYFVRADDLFYEDLSACLYQQSAADVRRILSLAVEYGIFDAGLFDRYGILTSDEIKDESKQVIGELNALGCKTVMLTGDNDGIAKRVAGEIGLTSYRASLLPQDKVSEVERLLGEERGGKALCFVGDGINDAPVLMRSDIGIAMGGAGSDAAIEASDIVLMKDDLRGIPLAKRIAKKTMRIVFENIVFSLAVKIAVLVLSAFGIANMWLAVFADVGVAVLAILNAVRALSVRKGDGARTAAG